MMVAPKIAAGSPAAPLPPPHPTTHSLRQLDEDARTAILASAGVCRDEVNAVLVTSAATSSLAGRGAVREGPAVPAFEGRPSGRSSRPHAERGRAHRRGGGGVARARTLDAVFWEQLAGNHTGWGMRLSGRYYDKIDGEAGKAFDKMWSVSSRDSNHGRDDHSSASVTPPKSCRGVSLSAAPGACRHGRSRVQAEGAKRQHHGLSAAASV